MALTLIDERKYPSTRRGSDSNYLCKKWNDGSHTCDCPGWRFKQPDKPRGCSHCEWFKQDYWLVTIGQATELALKKVKWDKITTYNGTNLWLIKPFITKPTDAQYLVEIVVMKQVSAPMPDSVVGGRLPRTPTLPKPVTRPVGAPDPRLTQPKPQPARAARVFDDAV